LGGGLFKPGAQGGRDGGVGGSRGGGGVVGAGRGQGAGVGELVGGSVGRGGGGFGMERVREGGGAARIETADRIANGPQGVRQQTEVLRPAFLPMVPW